MEFEKEEIFDKIARENMEYWSLQDFKKQYISLFKTIMKAMDEFCYNREVRFLAISKRSRDQKHRIKELEAGIKEHIEFSKNIKLKVGIDKLTLLISNEKTN